MTTTEVRSVRKIPAPAVYLVDAVRSPSVSTGFQRLDSLTGDLVRQLPDNLRKLVDLVLVTHRYPTGYFDRGKFLETARLRDGDSVPVFVESGAPLGGLRSVDAAIEAIRSGRATTVVVVGGEVNSLKGPASKKDLGTRRRHLLSRSSGLPHHDRDAGLTTLSANALLADQFFRCEGLTVDALQKLMLQVTCHLSACADRNQNSYQVAKDHQPIPKARYAAVATANQRRSKWPFHLFDSCAATNGGAALVLSAGHSAAAVPRVRVAACELVDHREAVGLLEVARMRPTANKRAWSRLPESALEALRGTAAPGHPAIILELLDSFAYQVGITLLELEICDSVDRVIGDFESGYFDPESPNCRMMLCPSGGSRDGHPAGAAALLRLAECFGWLTGRKSLVREASTEQLQWAFVNYWSAFGGAGVACLQRTEDS